MYFRVNFEVHTGYGGPFRLVNTPILGKGHGAGENGMALEKRGMAPC